MSLLMIKENLHIQNMSPSPTFYAEKWISVLKISNQYNHLNLASNYSIQFVLINFHLTLSGCNY